MQNNSKITPCLWFDDQAEAAAQFYTSIFRNSKIVHVSRYGDAGQEIHGKPAGAVITVSFELDGQPFTALNGGPTFKFNEAISFQIFCDTQADVDDYWQKLSAGGDETAQQCGWLKDKSNRANDVHVRTIRSSKRRIDYKRRNQCNSILT
ncbi:VOC family protein [Nostoc sp.]|uniref:VOC family protein n=1 Tax=Nostoc sp. TaxID=1180 RepID=UPI002FFB8FA7